MSKHGGYPGGMMPGNMNNLMKQAQKVQAEMQAQQAALEQQEFTASTGGGAVTVVMTGKRELKSITLSKDAVDPDDVEMLQDLIVTAVNEALRAVNEASEAGLSKLTGGFGGLF